MSSTIDFIEYRNYRFVTPWLYGQEKTIEITCHFPRSMSHVLIPTNFSVVRICTGWWLIVCSTNLASRTNFVKVPWVFASYCLSLIDPIDPSVYKLKCSRKFFDVRDQGFGNQNMWNLCRSQQKCFKSSAEPPRLLKVLLKVAGCCVIASWEIITSPILWTNQRTY